MADAGLLLRKKYKVMWQKLHRWVTPLVCEFAGFGGTLQSKSNTPRAFFSRSVTVVGLLMSNIVDENIISQGCACMVKLF